MTNKIKAISVVAILALTFAAGRYSVPLSVKTEKQVSKTDTKTDNKAEEEKIHKHTKTTVVDTTNPNGTKTHTVTKEVDLNNDKKTTDATTDTRRQVETSTKEVTRRSSRLTVSALAGAKISFSDSTLAPDYGVMVSRDLLGPVSLGIFGFKSGFAGVGLGLSF